MEQSIDLSQHGNEVLLSVKIQKVNRDMKSNMDSMRILTRPVILEENNN